MCISIFAPTHSLLRGPKETMLSSMLPGARWVAGIVLIACLQGCLGIEYFRSTYTSVCPGEVFSLEYETNGADRVEIDPLPYDSAHTPPGKGRAEVKIQHT